MLPRRLVGLLAVLAVPARALTGARPGAGALSSLLQTEADADTAAMASMATLSKAEWQAKHQAMYKREFTIELNMTAAHEGTPIGVELWSPKNNKPLAVMSLLHVGLVEHWNAAHPDAAVRVGDEIIKVNNVTWQNHNRMFIQHFQELFRFLKEQRPGTQKVLELGIQRPRQSRKPLESTKSETLR